ncbi:MAG: hypothetical protein GWN00_02110, partial [Aliifodinibius sp.]|nr:hypothetical protein [Fodinibius sp.]NIV12193.1 hypothetical protein [Fodinibius sp.]NIY23651.1 hypothetical protein [Fodinibius sp.]
YQPVTRGERIRLRMMAGTSEGALPLQKNFELGGISTLRAFNYKAFSGNRMFLTNVEYVFDSDILGSFLGIDHFNLIIFG